MNRFGVIDDVASQVRNDLQNRFANSSYLMSLVTWVLDTFDESELAPIDVDDFIEERELQFVSDELNVTYGNECIYKFMAVLNTFLTVSADLPEYNKGRKLLDYFMYYIEGYKDPVKVFYADKCLDESDICGDINRMVRACGAPKDVCSASTMTQAFWFEFESAKNIRPDLRQRGLYKTWADLCVYTDERRLIDNFYGGFDIETFLKIKAYEREKLSMFMDYSVIDSTPLPVVVLYACRMYDSSTGRYADMKTASQGHIPLVRVNKICESFSAEQGYKGLHEDVVKCLKIYSSLDNRDDSACEDSYLSVAISELLCSQGFADNQQSIVNTLSNELFKFSEELSKNESCSNYDLRALLNSYIYYNFKDMYDTKLLKSDKIQTIITRFRSTLPAVAEQLSNTLILGAFIVKNCKDNSKNSIAPEEVDTEWYSGETPKLLSELGLFGRLRACMDWAIENYSTAVPECATQVEWLCFCAELVYDHLNAC